MPNVYSEIADHFFEVTHQKYTTGTFRKAISQAKQLIDAGYAKEDIIKVMDYAIVSPGEYATMYSLGYLQYIMTKILQKIKLSEIKNAPVTIQEEVPVDTPDLSNREKYERANNVKIKGMGKF
jgi:CRISPR/Cas system-associated protein Csx1